MSSPGSSNVEEDDEEEVIRRFLEESSELSPIKNGRGKKKIKWDLIAESLESPTKEDNSNFLSEGVIESNFVNSMVRPESQKVTKSSPSSSLNSSKRIQDTHPGLNAFSKEPFQYFSSKDLDLERDFGYKGRAAYEGALGPFDELKKDHLEFALLLCPESKSLLISNESDFKAIADYLFYSMSVVDSEDDFNVLSNSLVALCINYKFKWNIDYKKILTVYLNLGCNPSLIHNDGAIRRMIKSRLEVAARIRALRKKEVSTQGFSLSKSSILPPFALQRVSSIDKKYFRPLSRASDEEESKTAQKYNCLRRITKFLSVFSHQHKDRLSLMEPYDDWTGLLVVAYVMALMATDHRLIQLYPGCSFDVQQMLNSFLERFSHRQWSASMGSEISALCDVSKIFLYLGFTASPTLRTWDTPHGSEESLQKRDDNLDHHHNIVFRLSYLIPPTPRGRDLLKASAFLTLQFLLNREGEIVFEAPVSVLHVEELLLKDESLKKRFTGLFSSELYLAWSLLRTIDLIVGNDPVLDFSKELIPSVNQLSSFLRGCIRGLKDDFFDRNPSCLKEVVNQLLCKWNVLSLSSSKAYNTKITDFTVNKKK